MQPRPPHGPTKPHDPTKQWPLNAVLALILPAWGVDRARHGDRLAAALFIAVGCLHLILAIHRLRRRRANPAAAPSVPEPKTNP